MMVPSCLVLEHQYTIIIKNAKKGALKNKPQGAQFAVRERIKTTN